MCGRNSKWICNWTETSGANLYFGNFLEEALRDHLICGSAHSGTQKKLLTEKDLTLQKAIEMATAVEMAILQDNYSEGIRKYMELTMKDSVSVVGSVDILQPLADSVRVHVKGVVSRATYKWCVRAAKS